jgi:hypothetical protein
MIQHTHESIPFESYFKRLPNKSMAEAALTYVSVQVALPASRWSLDEDAATVFPLSKMAIMTWYAVAFGYSAHKRAHNPATCGAAMEVPCEYL